MSPSRPWYQPGQQNRDIWGLFLGSSGLGSTWVTELSTIDVLSYALFPNPDVLHTTCTSNIADDKLIIVQCRGSCQILLRQRQSHLKVCREDDQPQPVSVAVIEG